MNPGDAPPRRRLGEILIERGKLDTAALDRALRLQQESGGERLGQRAGEGFTIGQMDETIHDANMARHFAGGQ